MMHETIVGGRIKAVFTGAERFAAKDAAERWCSARGISVGFMERGKPRGLLYGEFDIAKWHNLRKHEIAALHGRMTGDMLLGPVEIDICTAPAGHSTKEVTDDHEA